MSQDCQRLLTTLEQMGRMVRVIDDMRENVLPSNPKLFGAMVEGPLDQIENLRVEAGAMIATVYRDSRLGSIGQGAYSGEESMEPDDIIPLFRAAPFKPFIVFMNDGSNFEIKHPEQAMMLGETLFIAHERRAVRCALLNISRIETEEVTPPSDRNLN